MSRHEREKSVPEGGGQPIKGKAGKMDRLSFGLILFPAEVENPACDGRFRSDPACQGDLLLPVPALQVESACVRKSIPRAKVA